MSSPPKLAGLAIGDYVTILNAYGREARGQVVRLSAGGCMLVAWDVLLRAEESNTVRVEHRSAANEIFSTDP